MILINDSLQKNIVLTLSEKTTIQNAYYLFEFISDETNVVKYLIPTQVMQNIRYNEFLGSDFSALNLTLGNWKYNVFEQNNNTNLITIGLKLVESGRVDIITTQTVTPKINYSKKIIPTFNG